MKKIENNSLRGKRIIGNEKKAVSLLRLGLPTKATKLAAFHSLLEGK
jgi:hypothetical protein